MRKSELGYDGTMVMRVTALTVDPITALPVVVLCDEPGLHTVTVRVGLSDAAAIATELDGIELERPMTHQLMGDLLTKAGVVVECVVISPVADEPCRAKVHLRLACGGPATQDARPSDALALALHLCVDIRMPVTALESSRASQWAGSAASAPRPSVASASPGCRAAVVVDNSVEYLERLGDESFGKWKI